MKKTINGIRYDTNSAILLGEVSSATPYRSDFSFWEGRLYKTKSSGRFFVEGSGGPMTIFSRPAGDNCRTGGDGIVPLDDEQALAMAERDLSEEIIEAHFAHMIEDA